MCPALNSASREFFDLYVEEFEDCKSGASLAVEFIKELIADEGIDIHAVEGRAKSPTSMLRKLRLRTYDRPEVKLTDAIGVRVITYYRDDVDQCVAAIRARLPVDMANSVDKRTQMNLREFGYRSVHLIGHLRDVGPGVSEEIGHRTFEIQVRSLLEHAWAEIEHEVVYKAAVNFDADTLRTFAAVAGSLELVDQFFLSFRDRVRDEVEDRVASLHAGQDGWAVQADAAMVIAVFKILAPDNPGWLDDIGLPAHSAALALEGLCTAGLTTSAAIRLAFDRSACTKAVETYAALSGISAEEVSHLALAAILVGTHHGFRHEDFPDLFSDPLLLEALNPSV